jgi:hypothetical protein
VAVILVVGDGDARIERPATGASQALAAAGPPVHPRTPRRYRAPHGDVIRVAGSRALRAALAHRTARTIVLAPGTYGGRKPFANAHGHRLYAARRGTARLTAGISLGSNAPIRGALVRGLVIDVRRAGGAFDGAAISVWGESRGAHILDTVVRGNGVLRSGISVNQPAGLVVKRVVARGFTGYGVFVDANDTRRGVLADPFRLEDVDVSDVVARPPGSSNGRAEACIWIGNTGTVHRARVRRCGWSGLWTGTAAHRATFDRIDVDDVRTGVYVEHFTHDSRFRRLRIGRGVRFGLSAEWASPDWGRQPASVGNVIEDSRFESSFVGVYLDEGTTRTTVRRSRFSGQEWAAIGIYRGVANAHYGNAVSGLAPGGRAFTDEHPSSVPAGG